MSEETTGSDQFNIVTEIDNAIRVIDYAAEQGAFKGWDTIQQVLGVRARLNAFVAAINETVAAQAEATEQDATPETETSVDVETSAPVAE